MEVFGAHSLLELRQLRHLFRAFPSVLFSGGYVRVRIQVHRIDRLVYSHLYQRILAGLAAEFNCESPSDEIILDATNLRESLVVLKSMVVEDLMEPYDALDHESWFQMMGRTAQFARRFGAFAGGGFGQSLFVVTRGFLSCANTGLDLLSSNRWGNRRWGNLASRLVMLGLDVDVLLQSPLDL